MKECFDVTETIINKNSLYPMIRAGVPAGFVQLHVVGFSFPADAPQAEVEELMAQCANLSAACGGVEAGILAWHVSPNLDPRKGFGWVEVGVFRDADAFVSFHAHPDHQAFGAKLSDFADGAAKWVVLDTPIAQEALASLLSAVVSQQPAA